MTTMQNTRLDRDNENADFYQCNMNLRNFTPILSDSSCLYVSISYDIDLVIQLFMNKAFYHYFELTRIYALSSFKGLSNLSSQI